MSVYTAQCNLFGTYSAQEESYKTLHAQNATTLIQQRNHSANYCYLFHIDIMRITITAHSKNSSNIYIASGQEDIKNYQCNHCERLTSATICVIISKYPTVLCIVLGRKKGNDTSITLAVKYPVCHLHPSSIFWSHEGTVDLQYNLVATVNHKVGRRNNDHYMTVGKCQMSSR